jgi:hypothetical protein
MTRLSTVADCWLGLCPKSPTLHITTAAHGVPSEINHAARPRSGGKNGIERIRHGMGIATESIRILINNKQLLGFSFLTGFALLCMFAAEFFLNVAGSYPHPEMVFPVWLALTFGIEMMTVFWINILLAGILESASTLSGRTAPPPETAMLLSLAGWSVILALAGTALIVLLNLFSRDLIIILYSIITQFPFAFILQPELNGPGPIGGGFSQSYAAANTLLAMMINLVLFVITLYVIPAIVLGNKRMASAVTESLVMARKTWGEILSCFLIFCLSLLAISLISVVFRLIFRIVSLDNPFWYEFWYKGWWLAAGATYMVVWYIFVVAGSTALGIATFHLYDYGKTGQMPHEKP